MDQIQAIQKRHSVRKYVGREIEEELLEKLRAEINTCNERSGLHIQLVTNEPDAFGGFMAHYGKFSQVTNYVALIGKSGPDLEEKIGYYGEQIVLKAQQLGLNTCWVAMTFSKRKSKCRVEKGEKLVCVLAIGYGKTQGIPHKSKPIESLCKADGELPGWFQSGIEAAMLAPTAINQQKFLISLLENGVKAESTGGFYSRVDLGIVKYHFEIGAGITNFNWV